MIISVSVWFRLIFLLYVMFLCCFAWLVISDLVPDSATCEAVICIYVSILDLCSGALTIAVALEILRNPISHL